MKEQSLTKETYERSSLVITEFSEEDVIVTSGMDDLLDWLTGDNDMKQNR